ncbi:MAG: glycosyltransferase family 1 protein, partial [Stellaceae bacterium]
VRPGENGILVPPGDVDGLAAAIAELAHDPARRRSMGRAGRALVEREFTAELVGKQTVALYRSALAERNSAA